ncbi:hypothetical protein [Pedobacter sp. Leaf170]|uniref:hypothetical protein n=1 Tax=Pedobacter sp. Leaf170 TaxID=2876558 RepID=UPI001E399F32|nr:hypothetical protein [Pedobacter sp. Leaf170]
MKKYIPYLIIVALVCVIGWLLLKPTPVNLNVKDIIEKESPQKVREYVDSQGNTHTEYDITNSVVSRADVRNPNIPLGIVDTSAMLLKIARTQLVQVTRIASMTRDSLMQARFEKNALQKRIARYDDKFVQLSYTPNEDTTKAGIFSFAYNNEVTVSQYRKRKWFLGAKKSYIDITSNDPRTKINGLKSLIIEQKQPDFGLRIQAASNYNPQTGSIGFGPAARIDLGRFSIQGNYTYYPESTRWRPSVNMNYDIIRF